MKFDLQSLINTRIANGPTSARHVIKLCGVKVLHSGRLHGPLDGLEVCNWYGYFRSSSISRTDKLDRRTC